MVGSSSDCRIEQITSSQNLAVLLLNFLQGLWFEPRMKGITSDSQAFVLGDAQSDPQVQRLHTNPRHHHAVFGYLDVNFVRMAFSGT